MRVPRYYNNVEVYFIKNVLLTGNLVHPLALPLYLYLLYLAKWPPCGKRTAGQPRHNRRRKRYGGASVDLHWQMNDSFWASKSPGFLLSSPLPLSLSLSFTSFPLEFVAEKRPIERILNVDEGKVRF